MLIQRELIRTLPEPSTAIPVLGQPGGPIGEAILVVVLIGLVVLTVRFAPALKDTVLNYLSGEPAGLLPRGLMRRPRRVRKAVDLRVVLSHLAFITKCNLPLVPALDAAAKGESWRTRDVLKELARRLSIGHPLSSALTEAFPACPRQLVVALREAERHGHLREAIAEQEQAVAATVERHVQGAAHTRPAAVYAIIMLLFLATFGAWLTALIMPAFANIFADFGVSLPFVTLLLLAVVDWLSANFLSILALMAVVFSFLFLLFLVTHFAGYARVPDLCVSFLRWSIPVTRRLDYGMGMARAIRAFAWCIRSGTAPDASALPGVVSRTNHLRPRLEHFSGELSKGKRPSEAARDANLGEVFVTALRMVERGEDADQAIRHAADYYESLADRWWRGLVVVSGPLVTLALGAVVALFALAMFVPMISLIDSVAEAL